MGYIEKTIDAYLKDGNNHENIRGTVEPDFPEYLQKFYDLLSGKNVLELGFGLGYDAEWLISKGLNYTGVDVVETRITRMKRCFPASTFIAQNIKYSLFPYHSFHGLWASAIFIHFKDQDLEEILERAHSWLKKDGVMFVSLKEGSGEMERPDGRFFRLQSRYNFENLCYKKFELLDHEIVPPKPHHTGPHNWINMLFAKV